MQKIITAVLAAALIGGAAYHFKVLRSNFVIADQGSFMAGGTVFHHTGKYTSPYTPDGQTFHGDHAYVFWQKPFKARKYPLVFIHGIGQFSKTFETTPADETATQEQKRWRNRLEIARKWAKAVNKRGGDATVVHLPDAGLHGNTHFPFSDLNNLDVAKLMSDWLHEKGLD